MGTYESSPPLGLKKVIVGICAGIVMAMLAYFVWQLYGAWSRGTMAEYVDALARTRISEIVIFVASASIIRLLLHFNLIGVPQHLRSGVFGWGKLANEILDAIVYALVFVFLLIRPFGIQAFTIPTPSMVPTLMVNDFIVANKAIYRYTDPKFQDVAVFKPPQVARDMGPQRAGDIDYIKRVIGIPGDTIEIRDNVLYRNGQPVNEPYKAFTEASGHFSYDLIDPSEADTPDFKMVEYKGEIWPVIIDGDNVNATPHLPDRYRVESLAQMHELRELPPAPIPAGHYLMIGDNRNNSSDGRYWGLIPRASIVGRAEFIWLPISRWSRVR